MTLVGFARRPGPVLTLRRLQIALGCLWLFDGLLQSQPKMFTPTFFGMMLRMGPAEPPNWAWDLGSRVEPVVTAHAFAFNTVFALVQLLIGAGLLWPRSVRVALALSIPWSIVIWLFGEACGGLFGPGASALTGAPGAALLYALAAIVLWPRTHGDASLAAAGRVARVVPAVIWIALWLGTAALEAESLNVMPLVAGSAIANAGNGEPAWLSAVNHAVGNLVGAHGVLFAACSGLAQASVGLGILWRRTRPLALVAGMAIGMFYGLVGQDFGGIFSAGVTGVLTSGATDPGTGPIIVLLALCLWSTRAASRTPARTRAPRRARANSRAYVEVDERTRPSPISWSA